MKNKEIAVLITGFSLALFWVVEDVAASTISINPTTDISLVDTSVNGVAQGTGSESAANTLIWVGLKDPGVARVERGLFYFDLSSIAYGSEIISATLVIRKAGNAGTPPGNASLYHLSDIDRDTYQISDYQATGELVNDSFATPTTAAGHIEQDVTSFIQGDVDNGVEDAMYAVFRIQIDSLIDPVVGSNNYYQFNSLESTTMPVLEIEFTIPEPSTMLLLGIGGGLSLISGSRKM